MDGFPHPFLIGAFARHGAGEATMIDKLARSQAPPSPANRAAGKELAARLIRCRAPQCGAVRSSGVARFRKISWRRILWRLSQGAFSGRQRSRGFFQAARRDPVSRRGSPIYRWPCRSSFCARYRKNGCVRSAVRPRSRSMFAGHLRHPSQPQDCVGRGVSARISTTGSMSSQLRALLRPTGGHPRPDRRHSAPPGQSPPWRSRPRPCWRCGATRSRQACGNSSILERATALSVPGKADRDRGPPPRSRGEVRDRPWVAGANLDDYLNRVETAGDSRRAQKTSQTAPRRTPCWG